MPTSEQPAEHEQAGQRDAGLGAERDRRPAWRAARAGRSRRARRGPTPVTPAVAPTDSQNPTDQASSGSTSSRPMTASASSRSGSRWRPSAKAVAPSAAIAPARRIDGSARVSTTNQAISATVAAQRASGRARRSSGAGGGEHERDVLAGDGGEVRQAARPEPLDHRRRLVAVVADHQAPGQRGLVGGQAAAPRSMSAAHAVRRRGQRARRGADVAEPVDVELADDVLPGDARRPRRRRAARARRRRARGRRPASDATRSWRARPRTHAS